MASTFVDSNIFSRHKSAIVGGLAAFLLGIPSALSGGALSHIKLPLLDRNFFDSFDYIASNWILPMGGLLIAIFTGWFLPNDLRKEEFSKNSPGWWAYKPWLFFLRFVAPVAIILIFLNKIGILNLN